jgi:hypothetical protein
MIIRIEIVLMKLQMMTGMTRRNTIKDNKNDLAVCLIKEPEYMNTFASVETS